MKNEQSLSGVTPKSLNYKTYRGVDVYYFKKKNSASFRFFLFIFVFLGKYLFVVP